MNAIEFTCVVLLSVLLMGLACFFGWRQLLVLRKMWHSPAAPSEERRYLRNQAYRRLLCCGLMVVFAGFLVGWLFLESNLRLTMDQIGARQQGDGPFIATPEEKHTARVFATYWAAALVVVLALLLVASIDAWAIARYGLRQHRKLRDDHRAGLEEQIIRHRSQRNGAP